MSYEFLPEEIRKIKEKYPDLELSESREGEGACAIWKGKIPFDRTYKGYRIIDNCKVKITIASDYPESFPVVYEVGGRAEKVGEKWGRKDLRDVHFNPQDGTLCLCVRQEQKKKFPPGSDFIDFIELLVIPYFYGLVYFEENGRWPWKEYSHGVLGLLEYYAETTEVSVDKIRETTDFIQVYPNQKKLRQQIKNWHDEFRCLCGSRDIFSHCHPLAWEGLIKLRKDMSALQLNAYKLLQPK